jgi:intracellular septation protein
MTAPTSETTAPAKRHLHPLGKLVLELGPLVVFFVVNTRAGLFVATGWFMAAMAISLVVTWLLVRRLPIMPLVSGAMVLIFGTLTLVLADELFIKMKPTIANVMFGTALLVGLAMGKNLLDIVFDGVFKLTPEGWRQLTIRWGVFFFVLAILNEVVWRGFSTDFWVAFKVWGVMPLTIAFSIAQIGLLTRHALPEEGGEGARG